MQAAMLPSQAHELLMKEQTMSKYRSDNVLLFCPLFHPFVELQIPL